MDLRKIHSRVPRHKALSLGDAHQKAGFVSNTAARIPSPLIKAVYKVLNKRLSEYDPTDGSCDKSGRREGTTIQLQAFGYT